MAGNLDPGGPALSRLIRDYGSIEAEAEAARRDVALFDFSFIARVRLEGAGCAAYLNDFQSRPVEGLKPNRIAYALRTDKRDIVRSDLTIWGLGRDCFEVFSGTRRDIADLVRSAPTDVDAVDLSETTSVFALQGPRTPEVMEVLCPGELADLPYFGCRPLEVDGIPGLVGRLGYTGEKGVELIVDRAAGGELWKQLARYARPAGFGAMDRLRIEAGFILFTNECSLPVRPVELGLERFAPGGALPPRVRLVCFRADAGLDPEPWRPQPPRGLPGPGDILVTSACRAADGVVGLGFVPAGEAEIGRMAVDQHAGFGTVIQTSLPLYDPRKTRPRGRWRTADTANKIQSSTSRD